MSSTTLPAPIVTTAPGRPAAWVQQTPYTSKAWRAAHRAAAALGVPEDCLRTSGLSYWLLPDGDDAATEPVEVESRMPGAVAMFAFEAVPAAV